MRQEPVIPLAPIVQELAFPQVLRRGKMAGRNPGSGGVLRSNA